MAQLHEPGISKGRKITGYILSALPSAMIVFSGIMKLIGFEPIAMSMSALHLEPVMTFIGALEIICVILYWIPRTTNLGFFLVASYVGGIIASEWALNLGESLPIPGLVIATLLYLGTYLRKPGFFGFGG